MRESTALSLSLSSIQQLELKHMNTFATINAGDTVRLLDTPKNRATTSLRPFIGKTFLVEKVLNTLVHCVGLRAGWAKTRFEKVHEFSGNGAQSRDFIIALKRGDKYLPAQNPRTYATKEQAHHVARLMAEKHGGRFVVFQAVAYSELPPPRTADLVELN